MVAPKSPLENGSGRIAGVRDLLAQCDTLRRVEGGGPAARRIAESGRGELEEMRRRLAAFRARFGDLGGVSESDQLAAELGDLRRASTDDWIRLPFASARASKDAAAGGCAP